MRIIVNGEAREVAASTLAEMLLDAGLGDAPVATALNRDFVPASERARTVLCEGDAVEIIAPMQGG